MIVSCDELHAGSSKGFIVLEGLNGSGKSSLSSFLSDTITKHGGKVCQTFEPGATVIGNSIRQILLGQSSAELELTPLAELLLFNADRHHHIEKIIKPALSRKEFVICDRFFYSTQAFQGYGRGFPLNTIDALTKLSVGDLRPDLVLLLDLDPEVGLLRTKGRDSVDSFELQEKQFHQKLREGFLEIAKTSNERFLVLDASKSIEAVQKEAWTAVERIFRSSR